MYTEHSICCFWSLNMYGKSFDVNVYRRFFVDQWDFVGCCRLSSTNNKQGYQQTNKYYCGRTETEYQFFVVGIQGREIGRCRCGKDGEQIFGSNCCTGWRIFGDGFGCVQCDRNWAADIFGNLKMESNTCLDNESSAFALRYIIDVLSLRKSNIGLKTINILTTCHVESQFIIFLVSSCTL